MAALPVRWQGRAHGGRHANIDLYNNAMPPAHALIVKAPREPRHWPGWRGRRAERPFQAQRIFLAAVERARAAYRPVREEIEPRLEAYRAECLAAEYVYLLEKSTAGRSCSLMDLIYRSPRRSSEWEVEWDPDACAEVERECRERGADVTFATWWHEITNGHWETDTLPTGSARIHIGTHSSYGNPGGGFDGGFSHGGHHGFGTTF